MPITIFYQQFKRQLKRLIEPCIWILLLEGAVFALDRWDRAITDGFSHQAVFGPFPPSEEGHLTLLTDEERAQVEALFAQPFRYFARGGQCFVFESYDSNYVLKCFKQQYRSKTLIRYLVEQLPFFKGHLKKRLKRQQNRFNCMVTGCHVAYNRLRDTSGILYLHLAATDDLPPVQLIDYRGVIKQLDPNQFPFYLQKKGCMLVDRFVSYRQTGDLEGAKQALHTLFEYLRYRTQCGVLDTDPGYAHNLGWIDGKGTNLDIGKLMTMEDAVKLNEELRQHLALLRTFFEKEYPELLSSYDAEWAALKSRSEKASNPRF